MLKLNPYLNFLGKTEEAFNFYKSVFGGEFVGPINRFKDVPDLPNKDQLSEEDLNKIMHVALMVGDNMLMGTDALESQGQTLTVGNNISLSLHPNTKEEADRLFAALGEGGRVDMPLQDMFWGDYFGMVADKFGIQWMVNFQSKK
jgi:PhnB protein